MSIEMRKGKQVWDRFLSFFENTPVSTLFSISCWSIVSLYRSAKADID